MKIQTAEKLAAMGFEFQVERVIDEEHVYTASSQAGPLPRKRY